MSWAGGCGPPTGRSSSSGDREPSCWPSFRASSWEPGERLGGAFSGLIGALLGVPLGTCGAIASGRDRASLGVLCALIAWPLSSLADKLQAATGRSARARFIPSRHRGSTGRWQTAGGAERVGNRWRRLGPGGTCRCAAESRPPGALLDEVDALQASHAPAVDVPPGSASRSRRPRRRRGRVLRASQAKKMVRRVSAASPTPRPARRPAAGLAPARRSRADHVDRLGDDEPRRPPSSVDFAAIRPERKEQEEERRRLGRSSRSTGRPALARRYGTPLIDQILVRIPPLRAEALSGCRRRRGGGTTAHGGVDRRGTATTPVQRARRPPLDGRFVPGG